MKKLHCIICDKCSTVVTDYVRIQGKKRPLEYCKDCIKDIPCKEDNHHCEILSGSDYQYYATSYSCLIKNYKG